MNTIGHCTFCQSEISKKESLKHFNSCFARQNYFKYQSQKKINSWFYLKAEHSSYWIDLLIPSDWHLSDLDYFLRKIWLECCGHLSRFIINDVIFERFQDADWLIPGEELSPSMEIPLSVALSKGMVFSHLYDYGSTTKLKLKICENFSLPLKKQLLICFRNIKPEFECFLCKKTASSICSFCSDCLCYKCTPKHSCVISHTSHYMIAPLLNSPRTGVCGYTGKDPAL